MVIECLEGNYKCGTSFTLTFHYKIEHKDKISEWVCGDESLSVFCIKELASSMKTDCSFNLQSRFRDPQSGYSVDPVGVPMTLSLSPICEASSLIRELVTLLI